MTSLITDRGYNLYIYIKQICLHFFLSKIDKSNPIKKYRLLIFFKMKNKYKHFFIKTCKQMQNKVKSIDYRISLSVTWYNGDLRQIFYLSLIESGQMARAIIHRGKTFFIPIQLLPSVLIKWKMFKPQFYHVKLYILIL